MTGIEWIFLATAIAGAGVGAYSSYQQGKAAEAQSEHQAKLATLNQRTMSEAADYEASQIRSKYRRVRGAQRAAAAKSGLTLDGSISDLFLETNVQEDLDVMATLYKGKQAVLGQEFKKDLFISQGKNARAAGNMAAVGSLLSGAGSVAGAYPTITDT